MFDFLVVSKIYKSTIVGTYTVRIYTMEPLYMDTPEMRTSPLFRILHMVPAT